MRGLVEAAAGRRDGAFAAFDEALEHNAAVGMPFDRALVELLYGGVVRRFGLRRQAIQRLEAAEGAFRELRAEPFLRLALRELAGCGQTRRARSDTAPALSPIEAMVSGLVAAGSTNREVATELIISIKTVERHLANIYRKLGVRNRSELGARWRTDGAAQRAR